jgi:hypothetical protein
MRKESFLLHADNYFLSIFHIFLFMLFTNFTYPNYAQRKTTTRTVAAYFFSLMTLMVNDNCCIIKLNLVIINFIDWYLQI